MNIRVILIFLLKVFMATNAFSNIDKFYPLFIRRCAPILKPSFVKYTNNFINRIFFFIFTMRAAWIWILWVKLCFFII